MVCAAAFVPLLAGARLASHLPLANRTYDTAKQARQHSYAVAPTPLQCGYWRSRRLSSIAPPASPIPSGIKRVFTSTKGGPLREAVWQHEWAARALVGVPHLHFHDLRHVAATLAAGTGAGVKESMYRISHSSPQAALRYQHATARRDSAIAEGISSLIQRERSDPAKRPEPKIVRSRLGHAGCFGRDEGPGR